MKRQLGNEYAQTEGYDTQITLMTNWIKNVEIEIRKNKEKFSIQVQQMKDDGVSMIKDKLRDEEKYFRNEIKFEMGNMYKERVYLFRIWKTI